MNRRGSEQANTPAFAHLPTHKHMYIALAFPEPEGSGLGPLDLAIISRAVSFDLPLMSVLGSFHLKQSQIHFLSSSPLAR